MIFEKGEVAKPAFYTYIHLRADDNKVFYVGKGKGRRAYSNHNRNLHWHRIVKKHGLLVDIVAPWESESDAFDHERLLIACFRDMGHPICNLTDGGDGVSGWIPSDETRAKISIGNKGKIPSAETRAKLSDAGKGRFHSAAARAKMSASSIGKIISPEQRAKLSKANTGRVFSEATRAKMSVSAKGKIVSQETCSRISAAKKGRPHPDGTGAKISAARIGRPWSEARRAAQKNKEKP